MDRNQVDEMEFNLLWACLLIERESMHDTDVKLAKKIRLQFDLDNCRLAKMPLEEFNDKFSPKPSFGNTSAHFKSKGQL
jgi:hypothetical protein